MAKLDKMVSIEFDYQKIKTIIQANLNDKLETDLNSYKTKKNNIDVNNLYYLAIIEDILNSNDK